MKNPFLVLIVVCLCACITLPILLVLAIQFLPQTADLPNGYYLKHHERETVYLYGKNGRLVTARPIDMFSIKGNCVYGMLFIPEFSTIGYFFLDTETGEYAESASLQKFDEWLRPRALFFSEGRTHFRALQARQGGIYGKYKVWRNGKPQQFDTW